MWHKIRGPVFVMASAFLFGATPVLGKLSYAGGSNALMLTFLRAAMALPVLLVILLVAKIPLTVTRRELRNILLLGLCGASLTTCLLYGSYAFIPIGMATTLHFAYPTFVMLLSVLLFREPVRAVKVVVLLLSTVGVLLFIEVGGSRDALLGVALALGSACTFSFSMLFQYRSGLTEMHPMKLCFYQCLVVSAVMLVAGLLTGSFTLSLTPTAWLYSFIVSMTVSIGALGLLQAGLRHVGSVTASLLSMLEPITGIIAGVLVLGEVLTLPKLLGCLLILTGVVLLTVAQGRPAPREPVTNHAE